ncbi:ParM/StbA family protein [Okeania sp.]|uniref:ParM/StbA family protein n=1 Tax=Okeania sp. TaxID=3100323 RepID=UPI002B4AE6D3|nr:ParM/StbA family protein [Okeania sp.]MEB3341516.1 ParM/StbA family protein [Okeania sp.]
MVIKQPAAAAMLTQKQGNPNKKVILSADLGRTATKACVSRTPNSVVFIPANVKKLTVEEVRSGNFESKPTDPLLDMWLEYQGVGYALGQLAADFGANLFGENPGLPKPKTEDTLAKSKVEDALVKVLACVGYFQLTGEFSVVVGLPFYSQEQFEKEKAQIISQLQSRHLMSYRGAESIEIRINKVWVMPEGYGTLLWTEANHGKEFQPQLPKLSLAIVDIGHQTSDFLMVDRFRFARAASKSEPFGMNKFYESLADKIPGADAQSLSLIEAVHKPEGQRSYRPRGATKPVDLDGIIPDKRKEFAKELCTRLIKWIPERVSDVILTGGGADFFQEDLVKLLQEAGLKPHLAQPPREANALGQYIYGEAQLATSK